MIYTYVQVHQLLMSILGLVITLYKIKSDFLWTCVRHHLGCNTCDCSILVLYFLFLGAYDPLNCACVVILDLHYKYLFKKKNPALSTHCKLPNWLERMCEMMRITCFLWICVFYIWLYSLLLLIINSPLYQTISAVMHRLWISINLFPDNLVNLYLLYWYFQSTAEPIYAFSFMLKSPKKVNLVAKLVRGMRVEDALLQLQVTVKRAAKTVYQVM